MGFRPCGDAHFTESVYDQKTAQASLRLKTKVWIPKKRQSRWSCGGGCISQSPSKGLGSSRSSEASSLIMRYPRIVGRSQRVSFSSADREPRRDKPDAFMAIEREYIVARHEVICSGSNRASNDHVLARIADDAARGIAMTADRRR